MQNEDKTEFRITSDLHVLGQKSGLATTQDAERLFPRLELLLGANPSGIGLSAIQTGNAVRLFVMRLPDGGCIRFLNPQYISTSKESEQGVEGCLSLPGTTRRIRRFLRVTVKCDNWGDTVKEFEGLAARVVQHEMDHLDGKTIRDRGNPVHGGRGAARR